MLFRSDWSPRFACNRRSHFLVCRVDALSAWRLHSEAPLGNRSWRDVLALRWWCMGVCAYCRVSFATHQVKVGADLSRTPPIYRPSLALQIKQSIIERPCTIFSISSSTHAFFFYEIFLYITDSSQKYGNMYKMYDYDLWMKSSAQEYRKDNKRWEISFETVIPLLLSKEISLINL